MTAEVLTILVADMLRRDPKTRLNANQAADKAKEIFEDAETALQESNSPHLP
jgi:hypothetical protein